MLTFKQFVATIRGDSNALLAEERRVGKRTMGRATVLKYVRLAIEKHRRDKQKQ